MKIALLGYGKMGQLVDRAAQAKGHQVVCCITSQERPWDRLEEADLCIDFSHPEALLTHVEECATRGKNLLIGTTGWEAQMDQVLALVQRHSIGALYAPNCSLGVHLFLAILQYSASLMNRFDMYDVGGVEWHHRQKRDAPSGTAKAISRSIEKRMDRVNECPIASVRLGSLPGKHLVQFSSPLDTIAISHEAHSREGFAEGAIRGAEWLLGRSGFYTIEEWMKEVLDGLS